MAGEPPAQEQAQAQLPAQPQAQAQTQAPRGGGGFSRFFTWLIILGLLAAVWWLASERNARRFTLEARDNTLVVGRGRFFPFGARQLGPEDGELWKLYAPFPLPAGAKPQQAGEYEDQTQLDRALFVDALACARQAAQKGDPASLAQAEALSARAGLLPGLSPAQQDELASLRGELALNAARGDAAGALKLIRAARARLAAARKIGGDRVGQVEAFSAALDDAARTLEEASQGSPRPIPPGRPVAAPAPDAPAESSPSTTGTPPVPEGGTEKPR
jgi:hypothetical protein